MEQSLLIRRVVSADRGPVRVTTAEVHDCILSLPTDTFTTHELAEVVQAAHPGKDLSQLEYGCRQSLVWLIRRGHARPTDATVKRQAPTGPYWATVYERVWKGGGVDCALLNRIFMGC